MDAPVRWYCVYCGDEHAPDLGTLIDARYAVGLCGKNKRPLVRSEQEAIRLATKGGKLREKGVPLGGGQRNQLSIASVTRTKAIQEGRG
jgi:hypothetical protein